MTTTDPMYTKALQLRAQALALLQEAQQIDGLKPFTVTHTHRFGNSTYVLWAKSMPDQDQAISVLDSAFEPERDEYLAIEDGHSLEEMTGASATSRLPDILASFTTPADSEDAQSS